MGPQDAVKACFQKYTQFTGRARRSEYWWFWAFVVLSSILVSAVAGAIGVPSLSLIWGVALFVPQLSAAVRRLHDTGRSGWWLLIGFVPVVGWIVLLIFLIQDTKRGSTQYGAAPAK